jgi:hypothetical protein
MRRVLLNLIMVVLAATVLAAVCLRAWAGGYEGEYTLHFSQDRGWHRNGIIIESVDSEQVTGKVIIDLNIGPQARAPMPDERAWTMPFAAKRHANTDRIAFSVTVGEIEPVEYSFTLFFIDSPPGYMAGTVALRPQRALKDGNPPKVLGALARKIEK